MSTAERPLSQPLALVRPADLYDLFQDVAGSFAFASCAYIGRLNAEPSPSLDAEFLIRIEGPVRAVVVLRSTMVAARSLAQGLSPQGAREDAESLDAMKELSNLFVGHLLTSCLGGRQRAFEPFLPVPSRPAAWPPRSPDAACALLLEAEAVEIRYWQEPQS